MRIEETSVAEITEDENFEESFDQGFQEGYEHGFKQGIDQGIQIAIQQIGKRIPPVEIADILELKINTVLAVIGS